MNIWGKFSSHAYDTNQKSLRTLLHQQRFLTKNEKAVSSSEKMFQRLAILGGRAKTYHNFLATSNHVLVCVVIWY